MGGWGDDEDREPSAVEVLASTNLLRQYDLLERWLRRRADCRPLLWPGFLRRLHAVTCNGIANVTPGAFRLVDVEIPFVYEPPPWQDVPELVDQLCAHVNSRVPAQVLPMQALPTALELGAYTLWRVNWVHPFADGNGRVARAAAYFVTCAILGGLLPGALNIHAYITTFGYFEYVDGLGEADKSWADRQALDLSRLEELIANAIKAQLDSAAT